jgi:membrane protein YdbS with pleckstrin-like domain
VSEIDDGLIAGEQVVLRTNKHWLAPIVDSKWAVLMLLGVVVLAWLEPTGPTGILSFVWRIVDLIQLGLFLGAIGWIVYNVVAWRTAEYGVTTHRVRGHEGLLKKRSTDSLLTSVSDVQSKSSVIGRSLGFGNIRIMTASGDAGEDTFTSMKGVDAFKKAILEQKVAASAQAPATPPVQAVGATLPAAPVPPPAPAPDPIATLTELAKLRDAGAITTDEYEAKKTELLSRI